MIDLCEAFLVMPEAVDPAPIVRFMNESPEVLVVFDAHLDGVATGESIPKWSSSMLFAAYIAGNVRAQLVAGQAKDDPVAGYRGVLSVYRALQPKGLSIPQIDELDAAESDGGLEAWVAARVASPQP